MIFNNSCNFVYDWGTAATAMAAMLWSRRTLSEKSGVGPRTIQRMAEHCGDIKAISRNLNAVGEALATGDEHGHIEFLDKGAPGIRFHSSKPKS